MRRLLSFGFAFLFVSMMLLVTLAGSGQTSYQVLAADANADAASALDHMEHGRDHYFNMKDIIHEKMGAAVKECDYELFIKLTKEFKSELAAMHASAAAAKAAAAQAKAAAPHDASVSAAVAKVEQWLNIGESKMSTEKGAIEFYFKLLLEDCPKVENRTIRPTPTPTPAPSPSPTATPITLIPLPEFSFGPITLVSPSPTPRPVPSGIQPGQTYSRYGVSPTPVLSAPVPEGRTYSRPAVSPTPTSGGNLRNVRTASLSSDHQIAPAPGLGSGPELGDFLPPIAGPNAVTFATSTAENEPAGPQAVIIGTVDAQGHKNFFQLATNAAGQLSFLVPAGTAALTMFRHFDRNGQPVAGATCQIVHGPAHIPNTQSLPNASPSGPAIIEGASAYELGGQGQGIIQLQTRGLDPLNAQVLVDGSPANIVTKAASDKSVVAQMISGMPFGLHQFAVKSGNQMTNSFHAAVVALNFQGLPKMHPGGEYPVVLNITGVPSQIGARVRFEVLGAATFADGSKTSVVAVNNGIANSIIRVTGVGEVRLAAQLTLDLPDFRAKP